VLQLATIKTENANCGEKLKSLRQLVSLANMLKLHTLQTTDVMIVSLVDNGGDKCDNSKLGIPSCHQGQLHHAQKVTAVAGCLNSSYGTSTPAKRGPDFQHDEQRILFACITRLVHDYITPTYPLETTYALLVNGSFSH